MTRVEQVVARVAPIEPFGGGGIDVAVVYDAAVGGYVEHVGIGELCTCDIEYRETEICGQVCLATDDTHIVYGRVEGHLMGVVGDVGDLSVGADEVYVGIVVDDYQCVALLVYGDVAYALVAEQVGLVVTRYGFVIGGVGVERTIADNVYRAAYRYALRGVVVGRV